MSAQDKSQPESDTVTRLEIKKIGNSTGLLFPKELVSRLDLKQGDSFFLTQLPDGGFKLSPRDPDFENAMKVARRGMDIYRNALDELAK